jgi:hypothetical protein
MLHSMFSALCFCRLAEFVIRYNQFTRPKKQVAHRPDAARHGIRRGRACIWLRRHRKIVLSRLWFILLGDRAMEIWVEFNSGSFERRLIPQSFRAARR